MLENSFFQPAYTDEDISSWRIPTKSEMHPKLFLLLLFCWSPKSWEQGKGETAGKETITSELIKVSGGLPWAQIREWITYLHGVTNLRESGRSPKILPVNDSSVTLGPKGRRLEGETQVVPLTAGKPPRVTQPSGRSDKHNCAWGGAGPGSPWTWDKGHVPVKVTNMNTTFRECSVCYRHCAEGSRFHCLT